MSRRVAGWLLALALVVLLICVAFSWRQGDRSSPSAEESPASTKTVSAVAAPTATPPPDVVAQRASLTVEINGILALKAARDRAPRFGRFFKEWFDRDPEGAILYLEKMPRQREYTAGLLIALGGLAKTDPDRAIRLAGTMATRKADLIVYKALFDQLTRENPSRAAELLDHIPEGDARRKATRTLVEEWADKDPLAALAWARAIPELLQRDAGIEAASGLDGSCPDQAGGEHRLCATILERSRTHPRSYDRTPATHRKRSYGCRRDCFQAPARSRAKSGGIGCRTSPRQGSTGRRHRMAASPARSQDPNGRSQQRARYVGCFESRGGKELYSQHSRSISPTISRSSSCVRACGKRSDRRFRLVRKAPG
jgi:hypothetical protein